MKWVTLHLLLLLSLSGCGVLFPYMYDAGKLEDQLTVAMSKEQLLKKLGNPDRVVQNDGKLAIWEYWLYPKGMWVGYLIHCPWHPYCFFPADPRTSYHIVLQKDELCIWGTPDTVRTLAWKVCGILAKESGLHRGDRSRKWDPIVSVIPLFMPPSISAPIKRLAVLPLADIPDKRVSSWLDLTLNFLRSRHPELVLVEREDLRTVLDEVGMQYSGRVDDETTVRIGGLAGADSVLTYRLAVTETSVAISVYFELRLLNVESGITLFRQITTATTPRTWSGTPAVDLYEAGQFVHGLAFEEAAAFGLAALTAAFGDNPLGIVLDQTWPGAGVKLLGLLHGGPGYLAALKPGDTILAVNGRPVRGWSETISIPAVLTVEHDGKQLDLNVER